MYIYITYYCEVRLGSIEDKQVFMDHVHIYICEAHTQYAFMFVCFIQREWRYICEAYTQYHNMNSCFCAYTYIYICVYVYIYILNSDNDGELVVLPAACTVP